MKDFINKLGMWFLFPIAAKLGKLLTVFEDIADSQIVILEKLSAASPPTEKAKENKKDISYVNDFATNTFAKYLISKGLVPKTFLNWNSKFQSLDSKVLESSKTLITHNIFGTENKVRKVIEYEDSDGNTWIIYFRMIVRGVDAELTDSPIEVLEVVTTKEEADLKAL